MGDDTDTFKRGWLFPEGVPAPDDGAAWYRMSFGDTEKWDLNWNAHVHLAHECGLDSIKTEVADSGVDAEGIRYAAVKTTLVVDGRVFESMAGADETSQQVRDPEHVWSVAESRSVKRCVKKALDIRPHDEVTAESEDPDARGTPESAVPDSAPNDIDSMPSEW